MKNARIRVGVSSCLLGENVRYDGGHKRDSYISRTLSRYFELVSVCPEMGIEMGVTRPPIHLVGTASHLRAIGRDDPGMDVTAKLTAYANHMTRTLDDLSGYLFKARSPSCGLIDTPVYQGGNARIGRGIYASAFLSKYPWLPAIDEKRLQDPLARDSFLERVFAYSRWQWLMANDVTAAKLESFHVAHKYLLMAHDVKAVKTLGQMVAKAGRGRSREIAKDYFETFMATFARPATLARHENALMHIAGYLRRNLDKPERVILKKAFTQFRDGSLSRKRTFALLRRYFRRYPNTYIAQQVYLYPSAEERILRGI